MLAEGGARHTCIHRLGTSTNLQPRGDNTPSRGRRLARTSGCWAAERRYAMPETYGWSPRAAVLAEHSAAGLDGLWTLLQAAEIALIRLGSDSRISPHVLNAGLDVREALGELDWLHPELEGSAVTADLGPQGSGEDPRPVVRALLAAALVRCSGLARERRLSAEELAMLGRVSTLLESAERRVRRELV